MKKKINFRRLLTALVCCCLLITGFSFNANATESNERPVLPTIDFEQEGTITLKKYKNEAGIQFNDKLPVVSGAEFTAYKVASISSAGVVSLIDNETFDASTDVDSELISTVQQEATVTYPVRETAVGSGIYKATGMELGIYLVVETKSPANYYATTDAFLVSIPQTNSDGTAWIYDIEALPKNNSITVDKSVTGGQIKADSYSIGDKIPFIVTSTIPKYTAKAYENKQALKFFFLDTMSDGLTFDAGSVKVYIGTSETPIDSKYYTVEAPYSYQVDGEEVIATVKISLTPDAIDEFKGRDITVKYSATLNEKAEITEGEMNSVTLTFTTNPQTGENSTTGPEITNVYTYQMDVTKTFDGQISDTDLSKVKFTLKDSDENLLYAKLEGNVWIIDTRIKSEKDGFTDKLTLVKVNNQYKLVIKGLKAGEYTLTEVSTINGYNLLKAPIEIEVSEVVENDKVTGKVYAEVGNDEIPSTTGTFSFTVHNTKGFELPKTGGMGTWMYTIGGLFLMAATAALMFTLKRRNAVK